MRAMALESIFKSLRISEKSAVSLDKTEEDYILDIRCQNGVGEDCLLAATSSNKTVRLFKRSNLADIGLCKGHSKKITGLSWGKKDSNLLYTSSRDETVRAWDIRMKVDKEVQRYEGADGKDNLFSCVDINAADQVLCAGLEADHNGNAFIFFWDTRNTELLGCYSESHTEEVTQVCFHSENPDTLSSSSEDGLVCIYDVSQTDEDDAISYSFNALSVVEKIGWCGPNLKHIYCTTSIDTVYLWDTQEGDPVFEIPELKASLIRKDSIDYVVDCLQYSDGTLTLLAGDHFGEMKVIEYSAGTEDSKGQPKVIQVLPEGHKSTVRCCHWDSQSHTLVTGAEDSILTLWSCKQTEEVIKSQTVKSKTKKAKKRSVPY